MPRIYTKKKATVTKQTVAGQQALERKKTAACKRQRFLSSAQIHQGVGIDSIEIEAGALSGEIFENDFASGNRRRP